MDNIAIKATNNLVTYILDTLLSTRYVVSQLIFTRNL